MVTARVMHLCRVQLSRSAMIPVFPRRLLYQKPASGIFQVLLGSPEPRGRTLVETDGHACESLAAVSPALLEQLGLSAGPDGLLSH